MIVARVRRTILERGLLASGDGVLVACSGGPDSAGLLGVLAHLAGEFRWVLHVASVDHGLRSEAHRDVALAARQAAHFGLPFHPVAVQVDPGPSIQARARQARYARLAALREQLGLTCLAVGHTRDDQAETVLMRMLRGAGLRGLAGIRPRRADGVVRPLFDCGRDDVAAYARALGLPIAVDPSNQDPRFERVRVRQRVMPCLQKEDARLREHLAQLADEAGELQGWMEQKVQERWEELEPCAETISLSPADRDAPWCTALLRRWLLEVTAMEVGRSHLQQLRHGLSAPAEIWLPRGFLVVAQGDGVLVLRPGAIPPEAP